MTITRTYPEGWSTTITCDRCGEFEMVESYQEAVETDTRWANVTVNTDGLFSISTSYHLCSDCNVAHTFWITQPPVTPDALDAAYQAWGLIANAYGGNWDEAPEEWRDAARRWRDEVLHPLLDALPHRHTYKSDE